MKPLMELKNISYKKNESLIIDNLSLQINKNDFLMVSGPSGSGKSTLLKLCAHLLEPTEGEIFFNQQPVSFYEPTVYRKKVSYCFQTPILFGKNIKENLAFPFEIRQLPYDPQKVSLLFDLFRIPEEIMKTAIGNLSGGEKQRLALLRNLLFPPEILLLDEITSSLDQENTMIVEKAICEFHKQGTTILWISHNPEQIRRLDQKNITINGGKITGLEG